MDESRGVVVGVGVSLCVFVCVFLDGDQSTREAKRGDESNRRKSQGVVEWFVFLSDMLSLCRYLPITVTTFSLSKTSPLEIKN